MMNILLINTFDRGGAANACIRLHKSLIDKKIDSKLLINTSKKETIKGLYSTEDYIVGKYYIITRLLNILNRMIFAFSYQEKNKIKFLTSRQKGLEKFSFPDTKIDVTKFEVYKNAELINLHWVSNFLDYSTFFKKNKKPIVWTLHDMNPFTGGEHFEEKYLGIDDNGFPINRIVSKKEKRVAKKNIKIKKLAISKFNNLTIVAPSVWLAEEARNSLIFKGKPVHCIPYGLNIDVFAPRNKNYSRQLLNIPRDKKVILFVADSISNNRKGFIFLKKAFEQLADKNLVLCAIGSKNSDLLSLNNIIELGSINDERLMSIAYSAADVFVIPSLMDNLPNTVLESILCGTPVIGFPVGGIPDMIQHGENGYLTNDISVNSLVETLSIFLEQPDYFDRIKIRDNAVKKYDSKVQAKAYIELFENILKT